MHLLVSWKENRKLGSSWMLVVILDVDVGFLFLEQVAECSCKRGFVRDECDDEMDGYDAVVWMWAYCFGSSRRKEKSIRKIR